MRYVAGLALVLALSACSSGGDGGAAVAVQECKDAVTAQLAYPADAGFPFFDPSPSKDSAGSWHVNGSVSAENGFGGKHTLHWSCTVDKNGEASATVG